jgi:hypothetical protein
MSETPASSSGENELATTKPPNTADDAQCDTSERSIKEASSILLTAAHRL